AGAGDGSRPARPAAGGARLRAARRRRARRPGAGRDRALHRRPRPLPAGRLPRGGRRVPRRAAGPPGGPERPHVGPARRLPAGRLRGRGDELRARGPAQPEQRRGAREPGRRLPGRTALPGGRERLLAAGGAERPRRRGALQPRLGAVLAEPPQRRAGRVGLLVRARLPAGLRGDLQLPVIPVGRAAAVAARPRTATGTSSTTAPRDIGTPRTAVRPRTRLRSPGVTLGGHGLA